MEALHFIRNYNDFEIPKTRNEIASYLKEIIIKDKQLDEIDKNILNDLKIEFELELFGTLNNSQSIIGNEDYDLFSQNQKYVYYHNDPSKFNVFINILGEGELIFDNDYALNKNLSTSLGFISGEIRGTILNKFGFMISGLNGNVFGNREAALLKDNLKYNYKFNERETENYFDETSGYITADFDILKFKFGRDRINAGYGKIKSLIDSNSPMFDYLSMNIAYKFFTFSYFHGRLLGDRSFAPDPVTGGSRVFTEKYIGYHRMGFNISNDFNFGAGEIIIYGDRSIDFSYLNPFNFYTSVEHSNEDRDNSMLFFDFSNKSIKGLKFYTTFLIDDISLGKLGTGWYGNKTLLSAGIFSSNLYKIIPVDFRFQFIKIDPYTYTHRLSRNSFTNSGYNLGPAFQPNSELFFTQINYRFNNRLNLTADFSYNIHGANPLNFDGSIKTNVGGNILVGHRSFDSEKTHFLDGDKEYLRIFSASINYEPVNQINFNLNMRYINNSLQNSIKEERLETFFTLSAEF